MIQSYEALCEHVIRPIYGRYSRRTKIRVRRSFVQSHTLTYCATQRPTMWRGLRWPIKDEPARKIIGHNC